MQRLNNIFLFFKNIYLVLVLVIFVSIVLFVNSQHKHKMLVTSAIMEEVESFNSEIEVFSDGSFLVKEDILYDFGNVPKHGIFRDLLTKHIDKASVWYKKRKLDFEIVSVLMDDNEVAFTTNSNRKKLSIIIGDPDKKITGTHKYSITYKVEGGLSYKDINNPELYWNVTGNDWLVNIDEVNVTVKSSESLFRGGSFCYKGEAGQKTPCQVLSINNNEVKFTTSDIFPGEEVTIQQALDPGVLDVNIVEVVNVYYLIFLPLLIFSLAYLLYKGWRFRTANKQGTIIARYEPYPDLLPMFTGVLIDGRLDTEDITAGLVYLAQQGFIKIKKINRKVLFLFSSHDYEITLLKPIEKAPTSFQKNLLELLFTQKTVGESVSLSGLAKDLIQLANSRHIITNLNKAVKKDLFDRGFYERSFKWIDDYFLMPLFVINIIYSGYLIYYVYSSIGMLMLFLIMMSVVFIVLNIFSPTNYSVKNNSLISIIIGSVQILLVFYYSSKGTDVELLLPLIFIVAVFFIFLALVYRRLTVKGYQALNHIKGFKDFLSVTDKDRFAFHNAPEKNPERFMEYLPYAIALGVDDKWAKVFSDLSMDNPSWYSSDDNTGFSSLDFTKDMSHFSQILNNRVSGSSGSGSAGGGVGGGGGGSW